MKKLEKKISALLVEAEESGIFPGAAAGIYLNKRNKPEKLLISSGYSQLYPRKIKIRSNSFFDLASLSKPLSTALSLLTLTGSKKIGLDDKINYFFPALVPEDKKEISIYQLLNHSSGLAAHRPFFRQLENLAPAGHPAEMLRLLLAEPLASKPGARALYSDLGYLLLGFIIEKLTATPLDQYFRHKVAGPLHLSAGLHYNRLPARRRGPYVATENCPWRGRVLRGEVSDENCWVLGGVAGHAGLFGRLDEVLALVTAVLEIWQGRASHPLIRRDDLRAFLDAGSGVAGSSWGLGFDHPTPGSSSSGRYLSPRSAGHLGFTGTSFWIDPERELAIVLLSNRVHPDRGNERIKEFRPHFHNRVVELLGLV